MKLTTILMLVFLIQVSALTKAQITLNEKRTSLQEVLEKISKQSGYDLVYSNLDFKHAKPVTIKLSNVGIEAALRAVFQDQPVMYEVSGKTLMVKKKDEPSFLDRIVDRFASIDVRGRVLDENNEPLVGAVVKIKGTSIATSTNSKGEFVLTNIDDKAILVISFLGYEPQEIKAAEKTVDIRLVMTEDNLPEVEINAGYYTVKDRERTGSISRITSNEIERQPVNNVLQAMQANIPGLQVTQNTGVPGGGFIVRIRGQNSLKQGNEAFYIIDGVPFTSTSLGGTRSIQITPAVSPLASINPSDIESIEVLKDADATAIYGARGANGVILITTKKGKPGKAKTAFTVTQGIGRVGKKMNLMNTDQYMNMRKEAITNDKLQISSTDYDINGTWDPNRNVDWQKELIGGTAPTTNILASLSGGTNNIAYLIGGGYYKEGTVFPGESSYRRSSGSFSFQYTSDNKRINIIFDSNYSQINSDLFTQDLTSFVTLPPNYPSLLNEKGMLNWENNTMYVNPIANTQKPFNSKTNNLVTNAIINYNITHDLKLKASFGYTNMDRKEFASEPLTTYSPAFNFGPTQRISNFTNNLINTWIIEGQADYSKKIGPGELNLLVGTTFQQNLIDIQDVRGSGYTSDALMGNIAAASVLTISERSYLQYRYNAVYGRLNYNLKGKYFLNLTGRRDGSSRFGIENRYANFGAVGTAWILSEEDFFKERLKAISFFKIRGSYGITGNDQIPDYGYLELWRPFNTYQGISTIFPSSIANPNYAWEVNKKAEAAIEMGLLKGRINLSVGYYSNRSSNQLLGKQLPASTGFQSLQDNLDAVISNTGLEFEIGTKNIIGNQFNWNVSLNLTIPKNQLISYPGLSTSGFDATQYVVGEPVTIKKLYNTYIDPQTGLYLREDHDKNGLIDSKDQYIISFNGRKFYGGLQNSFSYRNINLDFLFQFVKQSGINYLNSFSLPGRLLISNPINNQLKIITDRWIEPESSSTYQKYSTSSAARTSYLNATSAGNLTLGEASFIRLKNVSLSYNLPSYVLQKTKMYSAKVYLQSQNLFTITSYKGLDPETQSITRLPLLRVFTAGIQITF